MCLIMSWLIVRRAARRHASAGPGGYAASVPEAVWINGKFVDRDDARVSAFDAAVLHGVGLFETMLAVPLADDLDETPGRVFRIDRHMQRLSVSASDLGLSAGLKLRALQELVEHVVEEFRRNEPQAKSDRLRVRLTLTGGDLNLLASTGRAPVDPTVIVHVQPATHYPHEMFEKGVHVVVGSMRSNPLDPFAGHKTVNYWGRLRELRSASSRGAAEAIVLQVTNHIAGGTVSNIFAVRDGALYTPLARGEEGRIGGEDLPSPVLPGITRQAVIDAADGIGIGCSRRLMDISDLLDADEVFMTNSSWGVLPVVAIEAKEIDEGEPGPITRRLRELWTEMIQRES